MSRPTCSPVSVSEVGRDGELSLRAGAQSHEPLVPALDYLPLA